MDKMKNSYTRVAVPRFRSLKYLFLAFFTFFVTLIMTSCEYWHQPVRDYFEKWTNEVAIDKFEIEGIETYYDKDENLCIGSDQDVPVILFMRNPYHYRLGSTNSTDSS